MNENLLFDFFKKHAIHYQLFKHQPVFTIEDKPNVSIPGTIFKSLFLEDQKNNMYFVAVTEDKRVDLKALSLVLHCSRFSFGKAEKLQELLKVQPGSVTPFGLMFDEQKKVKLILDEDFSVQPPVNFHLLRNDMTVGMDPQEFLRCMELMEHKPQIIRIPIK